MSTAQLEYRVTWRRASWAATTKSKHRRFTSQLAAEAFIATQLHGRDRPELSPVTVELSWREVGPWQSGAARTVAQITGEALNGAAGIAYGIVLGRVVEAWADWRVIEAWANRVPAPDPAACKRDRRNARRPMQPRARRAGNPCATSDPGALHPLRCNGFRCGAVKKLENARARNTR